MSPSLPTAIVPLRGKSPNSLAGFVEASATNSLSPIDAAVDDPLVKDRDAILDRRRAVGNLREVVLAEFLLRAA